MLKTLVHFSDFPIFPYIIAFINGLYEIHFRKTFDFYTYTIRIIITKAFHDIRFCEDFR